MAKYDLNDEFEYLEDLNEFEEFLEQRKKKKIIIISIISAILLFFILIVAFVQSPYQEHDRTLQNDFEDIEERIDEYYPN